MQRRLITVSVHERCYFFLCLHTHIKLSYV